ncbi:ACT domain-containing protein [Clostridium sp. C2-6-12]|uniref:ACT domain-containing protein n=1 Tax=Clostridium sp. C2-6-12 TaxID=2698832 RepID=UPI001368EDE1|nr:ACT domain-containing protein [Clostridium sp. C2-6-12]
MNSMKLLNEKYSVCRLNKNNTIPTWAMQGDFFSITKTEDELSIVCLQENIPNNIKCEKDWRILKVEGPLDFSLVGILASISSLMAEAQISIFALSTYDTDYILAKENKIEAAICALTKNNYYVIR